jgi:K+/H+ antiporter YhaU regulatory subunit KhtT
MAADTTLGLTKKNQWRIKMAKYKFDGTNLKEGSKTLANVQGNNIRKETGSTVIANIQGDNIRQGTGSTVLANVRGDEIRQGTGTTKIATMKDVDSAIEGPGRVVKAALWFVCCR